MRRLLLPLLLLLAAGMAVWLLGGDGVASFFGAAPERAAPEEPGALPLADGDVVPELAGRGDVPGGEAVGGSEPPKDPEDAPVRHVLAGRIVGILPGESRRFDVLARRIPKEAKGQANAEGEFVLDVTSLFEKEGSVLLRIAVDHPGYRLVELDLDASDRRPRYEVELEVEPSASITGRVTFENGEPRGGVKVKVFAMGEDGQPQRESFGVAMPRSTAVTDREGRYQIRAAGGGPHLVLAVSEGAVPAGREVDVPAGTTTHVGDLVLGVGVSISGTVRFRGEAIAQASVHVSPASQGVDLSGFTQEAATWTPHGVAAGNFQVWSGEEGAFRASGLSPGPWYVQVMNLPDYLVPFAERTTPPMEVQAPARDVDIEVGGCLLNARVVAEEGALGAWKLSIGEEEGYRSSGHEGSGIDPVRALVPTGETLILTASADGFEDVERKFELRPGQRDAEITLELRPKRPRPRLRLTLLGPDGEIVDSAAFRRVEIGQPRPGYGGEIEAEFTDPFHLLQDLEPGTWDLWITPGGTFWRPGEAPPPLMPARHRVSLPVEGEVEAEVRLRRGGRLVLSAVDEAGNRIGPECRLLGPDGEEVRATYASAGENLYATTMGSLTTLSDNIVQPALVPGTYRVELTLEGYQPKTQAVEIREGETTTQRIEMAKTE